MDSTPYLHITDTILLSDVWIMPTSVEHTTFKSAQCQVLEIVNAPHLKFRTAYTKMNLEDLARMLYLADTIQWSMRGIAETPYEEWLKMKKSSCVRRIGNDGTNLSDLCNYILSEDPDFCLVPASLNNRIGFFFRKMCYHSYKALPGGCKRANPGFMKCQTSQKFEYVIETRLIPLPEGLFENKRATGEEPMEA